MGVLFGDNGRRRVLEAQLPRIVDALKAKGARKIILFGSLARGEVGSASDLDLIVILETEMPFAERQAFLYDGLGQTVALDILPYTPDELGHLVQTRPFIRQAVQEGKVIYEA